MYYRIILCVESPDETRHCQNEDSIYVNQSAMKKKQDWVEYWKCINLGSDFTDTVRVGVINGKAGKFSGMLTLFMD